jgi:lipopolysaccharide/colanic/teichoic acid biosynthesis glycosyltransferase
MQLKRSLIVHKKGFYERFIKRPMDFMLSLIALIFLLPVILIVAVLVKIKLGSPVLFKQARPGLNEKIFYLYKFRTMTNKKDDQGKLLSDDIRLTKFGKLLRSTSLDELPSLINIIKGDLSIVGPRPLLVKDLIFMDSIIRQRHTIRPGLTGKAQISGRNNISWEKKFMYDLYYLNNITLINDIKIIILTIYKVFARKDISSKGVVTSEDYGDYLLRNNIITIDEYNDVVKKYEV